MNFLSRREFLKVSALSACSLVISTGISGCDSSSNNTTKASFAHGVASGDPLSNKVIIWTRVTTDAKSINVNYEVAIDALFKNIIHNGTVETDATTDYTVKVDVQNLDAGSKYYYRFTCNATTSPVGAMKTLPEGSVDRVKMAVFSCANYTNGYFNAYMEASKITDLDVTLHLGDYIYEYGTYENDDFEAKIPSYATQNAKAMGREFPEDNNTECIALEDYRKRYALYHTDAGLQALHQACPMIVIWDDHEIANDTYKGGAQNHDSSEGNYDTRVEAALQAYFEWLPIRPIENKKEIYRSFEFGDLVSLNMLETRILSRDKQLNYAEYFTQSGTFLQDNFIADLTNPDRTMMGNTQTQWLQGAFASSLATWQVLGQQVLMGRMNLPSEILINISKLDYVDDATKAALLTQINTSLGELAALKMTLLQGGTISETDQARLDTTLPYNLDAWDGYYVNRETILATAKAYNKNLVVLAGDTHNSWANELKDMSGNNVGVEFATTSVSSPGMEEYLYLTSTEQAMQLEGALSLLIDDLKYSNLNNRGFMEVIFTPSEAISNWHYVANYDAATYTMNTARAKSLKTVVNTNTIVGL
jgi:alkaline phosphatase D